MDVGFGWLVLEGACYAITISQLLQRVLMLKGNVVLSARLYFDESGTHHGSKLMTVAGYWFDADQDSRFSRDWTKDLRRLGLDYAHMTDCVHGCGQYKALSLEDRVKSEKLLIEHIKRRTRYGFAITVDPNKYDEIMRFTEAPSCYTMCLMILFHHISQFARINNYKRKLKFFFEAGHKSAGEANAYMNAISAHGQAWVDYTQYAGHAFVDKRSAPPLQAADMLAWQTRHYYERRNSGHLKPRKDFVALVRRFDLTVEMNETSILALCDSINELAPLVFSGDVSRATAKNEEILRRYKLSVNDPPKFRK